MAVNEKARLAKEADYVKDNDNTKSVCCGVFYNKSKKAYEPCKNCGKCFKFKEYNTVKEERPQVKFHYIDSFRKCEYYKVRPIDETYIMTAITYNMLYVNDMACNYVKDLEKDVKESGDKELQKKFGAAMKRVRKYFAMINDIVGKNIDFLAEYNGEMDDLVDETADAMVQRMVDIFYELKVENPEFLAKTEMARTMVGFSISSLDNMIKEGRKLNKQVDSLHIYRLAELMSIVEDFSRWAFRKIHNGFNMNTDEPLMTAFRELRAKLMNHENVCGCLTKAEELYG